MGLAQKMKQSWCSLSFFLSFFLSGWLAGWLAGWLGVSPPSFHFISSFHRFSSIAFLIVLAFIRCRVADEMISSEWKMHL